MGPKQWDELLDKQSLEALILSICLVHQAFNALQLSLYDLKFVDLVPVLLQFLPLLRDIGWCKPLVFQFDCLFAIHTLIVLILAVSKRSNLDFLPLRLEHGFVVLCASTTRRIVGWSKSLPKSTSRSLRWRLKNWMGFYVSLHLKFELALSWIKNRLLVCVWLELRDDLIGNHGVAKPLFNMLGVGIPQHNKPFEVSFLFFGTCSEQSHERLLSLLDDAVVHLILQHVARLQVDALLFVSDMVLSKQPPDLVIRLLGIFQANKITPLIEAYK